MDTTKTHEAQHHLDEDENEDATILEECRERQQAELEFIDAAYDETTEAWHSVDAVTGNFIVHRILKFPSSSDNDEEDQDTKQLLDEAPTGLYSIELTLTMPSTYPVSETSSLLVSTARLLSHDTSLPVVGEDGLSMSSTTSSSIKHIFRKNLLNALPNLVTALKDVAKEFVGAEALFSVLSRADEWMSENGMECLSDTLEKYAKDTNNQAICSRDSYETAYDNANKTTTFGRRLIYSHHIISKIKRADIKDLATKSHNLTGMMKVGWPGLIIIEGRDDDCTDFYDTIRKWNWQYLVVRGEQQDILQVGSSFLHGAEDNIIERHRCFETFVETDDMSFVASQCREVGLETLFKTSMKVYASSEQQESKTEIQFQTQGSQYHGALVLVDHMNDPKGYQKWLRKAAIETQCKLLLKQCYAKDDFSKRPRIFVGLVSESSNDIAAFLKRWRTSKVDVDSKGRPCLERMLTVLVEGPLPPVSLVTAFDTENQDSMTIPLMKLDDLLLQIGGPEWQQIFQKIVHL